MDSINYACADTTFSLHNLHRHPLLSLQLPQVCGIGQPLLLEALRLLVIRHLTRFHQFQFLNLFLQINFLLPKPMFLQRVIRSWLILEGPQIPTSRTYIFRNSQIYSISLEHQVCLQGPVKIPTPPSILNNHKVLHQNSLRKRLINFFCTSCKTVSSCSSAPDLSPVHLDFLVNSSINLANQFSQPRYVIPSDKSRSQSSNGAHSGKRSHSNQYVFCSIMDNKDTPILKLPPTSMMETKAFLGNGISGHEGRQPSSQYAQDLIGVILLALHTLKIEKVMPSEANITSCIRYGESKYHNINVKLALECALEHQMAVMQNLGDMRLYIGRLESLWKCVNPIGCTKSYPKAVWEVIQKFLSSCSGRSAIMASESRYGAALILKNACIKDLALGEVLQILDMIITMKMWIILHPSGWKPIAINLAEFYSN